MKVVAALALALVVDAKPPPQPVPPAVAGRVAGGAAARPEDRLAPGAPGAASSAHR